MPLLRTGEWKTLSVSGTLLPTPLPWLPVLSNIPPPHLRREEATAKLLKKVIGNDSLSLRADIMFHPNYRLSSRRPIWWGQSAEDMTALSAWCPEWSATDVVNHSLVAVPSVWPRAAAEGMGAAKPF